jgi:putative DNA primase/helicase
VSSDQGDVVENIQKPSKGNGARGANGVSGAHAPAIVSECTDAANADAVYAEHPESFLWVIEWERWIAWDGTRWAIEGGKSGAQSAVYRAVIAMARRRFAEEHETIKDLEAQVAAIVDPKDPAKAALDASLAYHKRLRGHFERSQNAGPISSACKLLQCLLSVSMADLDTRPWLFNVRNGTIDLQTGELGPHERGHRLTQLSPVDFDPDAACPTWNAFVSSAMGGAAMMTTYLQRVVGYQMTGMTSEQCLVFHFGGGSNGKSTFRGTVQAMLGDYAIAAPRGLLVESKGNPPHPTELARLYGKRYAACAEVGEGEKFDEAKIKDLTGGDTIPCRRMNEDFWELRPTHKLDLFGNHRPTVTGTDLGIWRRLRLIPWLVTVAPEDQDKGLAAKLLTELPGVLAWAVRGCLEWQRVGLAEPEQVQQAGAEYRTDSDVLGAFLRDYCDFASDARCARKDLRKRYETWCEELGHKPVGARKLAERLRGSGVVESQVRRDGKPVDGWAGVSLKASDPYAYGEN